jgi:DNA replication protein DnaC
MESSEQETTVVPATERQESGLEELGVGLRRFLQNNPAAAAAFERGRVRNACFQEWRAKNPYPGVEAPAEELHAWRRNADSVRFGEILVDADCKKCQDRKWIVNSEHQWEPCPDCTDWNPQKAALSAARIPLFRQEKTFANFDLKNAPAMREAFSIAKAYADELYPVWLALVGSFGCGKTHLAYAIAHKAALAGWKVRFWTVPDLLDAMRKCYEKAEPGHSASEEIDELAYKPDILILDDLGAEKSTDWALEKMFQVIDRRYAEGRPTVFTNNDPSRIDQRVKRRLYDADICRVVICDAPNYGERSQK